MSEAADTLTLVDFPMRLGGVLSKAEVAYETWGVLNAARDNAVFICTGLSPSSHVASSADDPSPGWWEQMVGRGKPIDTDRHFVICANSLGSCFGSTGPASVDPVTGRPYRLHFPVLTLEDIANTAAELLDSLEIERLQAIVGPSMGGMTALAFCLLHPGRAAALVSISSALAATPFAIAMRSLQREIVRYDGAWQAGDYPSGEGPLSGMRLARKLGMTTYRSPDEWRQRFGRERVCEDHKDDGPFGIEFEVESYLEAHAQKFTGSFDANCYLYLSRAMDLFDAADHGGGSLSRAAEKLGITRALVLGVHSDFLFPAVQQQQLADWLRAADKEVELGLLDSIQGHDSFLVDMERFRPPVSRFFASLL